MIISLKQMSDRFIFPAGGDALSRSNGGNRCVVRWHDFRFVYLRPVPAAVFKFRQRLSPQSCLPVWFGAYASKLLLKILSFFGLTFLQEWLE